jgi:hypothetical protein
MQSDAGLISVRDGCFEQSGKPTFLLADTAWNAFSGATDDEWRLYLRHRSQQGFNAALVSLLPILHDRSQRTPAGPLPFDEGLVRAQGRWELNSQFFDTVAARIEQAAEAGITCGLVLLWVNYVEGTWGSERTPGFVMPEDVQRQYLAALQRVVPERGALLIVSGDAGFAPGPEIGTYAAFSELVRKIWPHNLITYHSAPDAVLPPELESMADVLIFQSGHHGEHPERARTLARRYRAMASGRPVMNAEPAYEAHRVGGGVGRFGRAGVRRQIWESVVGGASAGVAYGAHGLWGWHRNGDPFTSVHFSGTPLDWREALFLPGADDAVACRRIVEQEGLLRLAAPAGEQLRVADRGWGGDQVILGVDAASGAAAAYLPNGGPIELARDSSLSVRRVVDLERGQDAAVTVSRSADGHWVIDPWPAVSEALVVLDLS